jgi:hypothetical protein
MKNIALFSLILGLALCLPLPKSTAQTKKADAPKKKARLKIKCAGKVGFKTEKFEDLVVEALEKNGYEIVEKDDEDAEEFYFGLLADDGDLDDDGKSDAADLDDNGDGIDDEDQEFIDEDELDGEDSDENSSLNQARKSFFTPASFKSETRRVPIILTGARWSTVPKDSQSTTPVFKLNIPNMNESQLKAMIEKGWGFLKLQFR